MVHTDLDELDLEILRQLQSARIQTSLVLREVKRTTALPVSSSPAPA